jgi:Txe/YoeB family toxin of Txe-Axe toxin-antitoxin module
MSAYALMLGFFALGFILRLVMDYRANKQADNIANKIQLLVDKKKAELKQAEQATFESKETYEKLKAKFGNKYTFNTVITKPDDKGSGGNNS